MRRFVTVKNCSLSLWELYVCSLPCLSLHGLRKLFNYLYFCLCKKCMEYILRSTIPDNNSGDIVGISVCCKYFVGSDA